MSNGDDEIGRVRRGLRNVRLPAEKEGRRYRQSRGLYGKQDV